MIAAAKRTPGPGQYNFDSKQISGGKFSKANTISGIDKEIKSKLNIPGPGTYNDNSNNKHTTIPIKTIAKQQLTHVSDQMQLHSDYIDLFDSFN